MALQNSRFLLFFLHLLAYICSSPAASPNSTFHFNDFRPSDLSMSGSATVIKTGALRLTDGQLTRDDPGRSGHAFYPTILQFKNSENAKTTQSFSTRFVFEIASELQESGGHGFAFVVAPSTNFSGAMGDRYLGLFNQGNDGNQSNHIFAVEFDTVQQATLKDIDANHVGVDVNSVISNASEPAAYYTELGRKENVVLDVS